MRRVSADKMFSETINHALPKTIRRVLAVIQGVMNVRDAHRREESGAHQKVEPSDVVLVIVNRVVVSVPQYFSKLANECPYRFPRELHIKQTRS